MKRIPEKFHFIMPLNGLKADRGSAATVPNFYNPLRQRECSLQNRGLKLEIDSPLSFIAVIDFNEKKHTVFI